jgi:GTPase SAR1 family protein
LEYHEVTDYFPSFENNSSLVVILFDLTDEDSFDEAVMVAGQVKSCPKLLVGNKADLTMRRVVEFSEAAAKAKKTEGFCQVLMTVK